MSLLLNMLSRLVITFLPRSKRLLISWLQSPSAVTINIFGAPKIAYHCFPIYLPWSDVTRCSDLDINPYLICRGTSFRSCYVLFLRNEQMFTVWNEQMNKFSQWKASYKIHKLFFFKYLPMGTIPQVTVTSAAKQFRVDVRFSTLCLHSHDWNKKRLCRMWGRALWLLFRVGKGESRGLTKQPANCFAVCTALCWSVVPMTRRSIPGFQNGIPWAIYFIVTRLLNTGRGWGGKVGKERVGYLPCWVIAQDSHQIPTYRSWESLDPVLHKSQAPLSSVWFSRPILSDSLWPHGLQHARPPCPSPTPRACSDSCPLSCWCHPTISSSVVPFSSHLQSFPASVFSNESALRIRWPKYRSFSFSISPSNEYSGLMSFRVDWLDLPAVQGTLKSLLQHHSSKASILQCSTFSSSHQSAKMHSPRQHRDIQGWKLRHTLYKFNM